MKKLLLFFILITTVHFSQAQFTDRYWCFGDSAGIDFSNLSNPIPGHSVLRARGTCASICDNVGNLLFYAGSNDSMWLAPNNTDLGYVLNKNHHLMQNGDSISTDLWYQEMIITPDPGNINRFYLFAAGVSIPQGFCYSIIDLTYNGGLGKVVQKNIQLQNFQVNDGLAAVKHGNGRDWWVVTKPYSNSTTLDAFYFYLITPTGISGPFIQHIGYPIQNGAFLRLKFTQNGSKLFAVAPDNLIESYDFNRCTGVLSNVNTISPNNYTPTSKHYWSFAVSPDISKLYTTSYYLGTNGDTSYLTQYNLNVSNILASADTLFTFTHPDVAGLLQTGPDGKVYLSCIYDAPDCASFYLYCDTTWNMENSNLSVINYPDSLGTACDFQPFSFNLGGHRTYLGLPNNPNYELKADSGSACDTLNVGLQQLNNSTSNLFLFYDAHWQKTFINAQKLLGRNYVLSIFDITGREVFHESGKLDSWFFTRDLEMSGYAPGLYIINFSTEKEKLVKKLFVK